MSHVSGYDSLASVVKATTNSSTGQFSLVGTLDTGAVASLNKFPNVTINPSTSTMTVNNLKSSNLLISGSEIFGSSFRNTQNGAPGNPATVGRTDFFNNDNTGAVINSAMIDYSGLHVATLNTLDHVSTALVICPNSARNAAINIATGINNTSNCIVNVANGVGGTNASFVRIGKFNMIDVDSGLQILGLCSSTNSGVAQVNIGTQENSSGSINIGTGVASGSNAFVRTINIGTGNISGTLANSAAIIKNVNINTGTINGANNISTTTIGRNNALVVVGAVNSNITTVSTTTTTTDISASSSIRLNATTNGSVTIASFSGHSQDIEIGAGGTGSAGKVCIVTSSGNKVLFLGCNPGTHNGNTVINPEASQANSSINIGTSGTAPIFIGNTGRTTTIQGPLSLTGTGGLTVAGTLTAGVITSSKTDYGSSTNYSQIGGWQSNGTGSVAIVPANNAWHYFPVQIPSSGSLIVLPQGIYNVDVLYMGVSSVNGSVRLTANILDQSISANQTYTAWVSGASGTNNFQDTSIDTAVFSGSEFIARLSYTLVFNPGTPSANFRLQAAIRCQSPSANAVFTSIGRAQMRLTRIA